MRSTFFAQTFLAIALLGGCATQSIDERIALAESIADRAGFKKIDIDTARFRLAAFIRPAYSKKILRIYIEGDGFAWATRHHPSVNPTPTDPLALKLAAIDTHDAAYLARPCQYSDVSVSDCSQRYWTNARFAPEVVDAMNEAVNSLKKIAKAEEIILIGYSGGGTVAALITARRNDVARLVTIAGNLDHKAWSRIHSISMLKNSLNPPDYWREIGKTPQLHFIGQADRVVPPEIYELYRVSFRGQGDMRAEILPDVDHSCCWGQRWPNLSNTFDQLPDQK